LNSVAPKYRINLKRFCLIYLGLFVGLPIAFMLIARVTGFDMGSAAASILPIMMAAMIEGMHFVRTTGEKPRGGAAWRLALIMARMALFLSGAVVVIVMIAVPDLYAFLVHVLSISGLLVIISVYTVLMVVLGRVFFGLGARNELKIQRLNAKDKTK